MAHTIFRNNVETTLSIGINTSVTTFTVASGAQMAVPGTDEIAYATLRDAGTGALEVFSYTSNVANVLSNIVRNVDAVQGGVAKAFAAGTLVEQRIPKIAIDEFIQRQGDNGQGANRVTGNLSWSDAAGPIIMQEATSATNPVIIPNRAFVDAGLFGTATGDVGLIGRTPAPAATKGGNVLLVAGPGSSLNGAGGDVNLDAGLSNNNGASGVVNIRGGAGSDVDQATGGAVNITGGTLNALATAFDGGPVTIAGGVGGDILGDGGNVTLTAGRGGLTSGDGGNIILTSGAGTVGAPGDVQLLGGLAGPANIGGEVKILAGTGNTTGAGGDLDFDAGVGGATAGDGGSVRITAGLGGAGGDGGSTILVGGTGAGGGSAGLISVTGGRPNGAALPGGSASLVGGQAATGGSGKGGAVLITAGAAGGGSSTGGGGDVTVTAGLGGISSGAGGLISITSGAGNTVGANSGNATLAVGTAGATSGNSGDLLLTIGTAGGTQGAFKFLKTGVASVAGQHWIASGTDGTGYWGTVSAAAVLSDADGDTLIQVEESADEDIIRFDVGPTPTGYGAISNIMTLASSGWTTLMGSANLAATTGAAIVMTAGTGNTSGAGGGFTLTAGTGGASGVGGNLILDAGNSGGNGAGGNVNIQSGDGGIATGGNSGNITIQTGTSANDNSGTVTINTGTAPGGNVGDILFNRGGVLAFELDGLGTATGFHGVNAAGPAMVNEVAAFGNPTLIPDRGELTTGVGKSAASTVTLIGAGQRVADFLASAGNGLKYFRVQPGDDGSAGVAGRLKLSVQLGAGAGDSEGAIEIVPLLDSLYIRGTALAGTRITNNTISADHTTSTVATTMNLTSFAGGDTVISCTATAAGNPGNITINAANAGGGGNIGGDVTLLAGTGNGAGDGGLILLTGGAGGSTGSTGGAVSLVGGRATTNSAFNGGATSITGGAAGTGTSTGNGGAASIAGGVSGITSGTSGAVLIDSGAAGGTGSSTGNVTISVANGGAVSGNSGDLSLLIGSAGGTQGDFKFLKTGIASVSGEVWTASSTDGTGYWAAAAGGTSLADADGDTLIQVEEAADEDIIRFDTGATPTGYGAVPNIMTLASSGWTTSLGTSNVATTAGAPITITSGAGNTSGAGGALNLNAGTAGANGTGGTLILTAGAGGSVNGAGGNLDIDGGTAAGNGTGGRVRIIAGGGGGANAGGAASMSGGTGVATGPGGSATVQGGSGNSTGAGGATIIAAGTGGASTGNAGDIQINQTIPAGSGVAGVMDWQLGGTPQFTWTTTMGDAGGFHGANAAGPAILNEASSATNPTLIPNQAELDTGWGWVTDTLVAVLGGANAYSFDTTEFLVNDKLITRPVLKDYGMTLATAVVASGTLTIDYSAGNAQQHTLSENVTTVTVTNPPASGTYGEIWLRLTQDAVTPRTVAWASAYLFPGGTDHVMSSTASEEDWLHLKTVDAGTTWYVDFELAYA